MDEVFGRRHVLGDKSRDVGFSWMAIYKFFHAYNFTYGAHLGFISRDKDAVDDPGNPDSTLPKMDLIYESMPSYLKTDISRTKGKLLNNWTGSSVTSEAPTINAFRGGRKLAILSDETAYLDPGIDSEILHSMRMVTNSLFMVSTLKWARGAFYKLRELCRTKPDTAPAVYLTMNWKDVPDRRRNMYTADENRNLVPIDPNFDLPADYPYILDGAKRSPYYDQQWHEAGADKRLIRRELDQDAGAANECFFEEEKIRELVLINCKEPVRQCLLLVDEDQEWMLRDNSQGPLAIWCPLDSKDRPPLSRYAIACDLSAGTATSTTNNSVAHIIDIRTGEQVAEYVTNSERPEMFARKVHALARMFFDAEVNWEVNNFGTVFKTELIEALGYTNVWMHIDKAGKRGKKTKKPGWHNGTAGLEILFSSWEKAIYSGKHIIRSAAAMREVCNYVFKNGRVEYAQGLEDTESDSGTAHGDRVVAAALAWMVASGHPWGDDQDANMVANHKIKMVMDQRRCARVVSSKPKSFLVFS